MSMKPKRTPSEPPARKPGSISRAPDERPVVAAILANVAIGIVKFVAAALSGSSAMVAEGIHSIVDSGNAVILLFGMKRAERPADAKHPFGYGREVYFWTLIVGILLFALGGGLSITEGLSRFREITPDMTLGNPTLNYVIIGISMAIEGYALAVAVRSFNRRRAGRSVVRHLREAKDPSLFAVMIEDISDELGLLLALVGTLLAHLTGNLYFDALASVLIGLLLTGMALALLRETKGLLIGEGLDARDLARVRDIVEGHPAVEKCSRILTLYLGPDDLLITIEATFSDSGLQDALVAAIGEIEHDVIAALPQTRRIFIEPQPPARENPTGPLGRLGP